MWTLAFGGRSGPHWGDLSTSRGEAQPADGVRVIAGLGPPSGRTIQMSQSTHSGRRDAIRVSRDEAEVREALLEHTGAIALDDTDDGARLE